MTDITEKANAALDLAKLDLLGVDNATFLTSVLFSMQMCWDTMENMPPNMRTLYVNGIEMGINKEFFVGLSSELRVSALAHEAWHVCFRHITRRGDRHPLIWNFAGDYIINWLLKEAGFAVHGGITLEELMNGTGQGWLLDPAFRNDSTDEVYEKIMQKLKDKASQQGKTPDEFIQDNFTNQNANGFGNDVQEVLSQEDKDKIARGEKSNLDRKIDSILTKAKIQAELAGDKSIGNMPSEISRYLDDLSEPKVPWQTLLWNYMTAKCKDDYSYQMPNRRFLQDDIILPSLYSESLGKILFIDDLSMSVTDDDIKEYITEGKALKETMNPKEFVWITFDTQIQSVNRFSQDEEIGEHNLELNGGGGTNIAPVLDFINEEKPDIAVVFTDGKFWWPDIEYDTPVLWLIYKGDKDFDPPSGTVIHYD